MSKAKADLLLSQMTKQEAIQLCNDCLYDLDYDSGSVGYEDEDVDTIRQIANFLAIKKELENII